MYRFEPIAAMQRRPPTEPDVTQFRLPAVVGPNAVRPDVMGLVGRGHGSTAQQGKPGCTASRTTRPVAVAALDLVIEIHRVEPHQFRDGGGIGQVVWQEFEASGDAPDGTATLFQSWRWLDAWMRTAATAFGEQAVIAVGRRATGEIAAILPFARIEKFGRPVLTWLGAAHHNHAMPIAHPSLFAGRQAVDITAMIDAIARSAGADAVYLTDQPIDWPAAAAGGRSDSGAKVDRSNPFAAACTVAAPNAIHVLALAETFEPQYNALFSAKTRSQLRRKLRRLSDLGPVTMATAATLDDRLKLLAAFFEQKRAQLSAQGAPNIFDRPEIAAFYRDLADDQSGGRAHMDIMGLWVGPRVAATVLSMRQGRRVHMLNTSFAADPDLADASPGKLLIHAHVAACHAAGAQIYDFGPGDAAYKAEWQATPMPLAALVRGVTVPGRAVALALGSALHLKRVIKRTPMMWRAARTARRVLAGRDQTGPLSVP